MSLTAVKKGSCRRWQRCQIQQVRNVQAQTWNWLYLPLRPSLSLTSKMGVPHRPAWRPIRPNWAHSLEVLAGLGRACSTVWKIVRH